MSLFMQKCQALHSGLILAGFLALSAPVHADAERTGDPVAVQEHAVGQSEAITLIKSIEEMPANAYLAPEQRLVYDYTLSRMDTEIPVDTRQELKNFLLLSIFMSQMNNRHQELMQLSGQMQPTDPDGSHQLQQLILAEKTVVIQQSMLFVSSLNLTNPGLVKQRMAQFEAELTRIMSAINQDSIEAFQAERAQS